MDFTDNILNPVQDTPSNVSMLLPNTVVTEEEGGGSRMKFDRHLPETFQRKRKGKGKRKKKKTKGKPITSLETKLEGGILP